MEYLCAPWRSVYFGSKGDECPFCRAGDASNSAELDEQNGILFRAKHCFGVMNLFPYNPGAFMVIPYEHTNALESLDSEVWLEMSEYVRAGVGILKDKLGAGGVNIGMNLGAVAGAGISEHIHYHLVPRWFGDTNFITTICDVRVGGTPFWTLYQKLKSGFDALNFK